MPCAALIGSAERELQAEFFTDSRYVPLTAELAAEARAALAARGPTSGAMSAAWAWHVHSTLAYRPNATAVTTLATDALKLRAGVCQDFAHVMLGLCRSSEIPARYVSGYFYNPERRPGEIEASHAWVEAFLPGYGWAAYDPTHDRPADERYVKVGVGRDYADISPVSGTYRWRPRATCAWSSGSARRPSGPSRPSLVQGVSCSTADAAIPAEFDPEIVMRPPRGIVHVVGIGAPPVQAPPAVIITRIEDDAVVLVVDVVPDLHLVVAPWSAWSRGRGRPLPGLNGGHVHAPTATLPCWTRACWSGAVWRTGRDFPGSGS